MSQEQQKNIHFLKEDWSEHRGKVHSMYYVKSEIACRYGEALRAAVGERRNGEAKYRLNSPAITDFR
jgi:hypothetical protein